jgi:hypothetical protein
MNSEPSSKPLSRHSALESSEAFDRRSADFQICCVADFQVGRTAVSPAGLETRDTAGWETCATRHARSEILVENIGCPDKGIDKGRDKDATHESLPGVVRMLLRTRLSALRRREIKGRKSKLKISELFNVLRDLRSLFKKV